MDIGFLYWSSLVTALLQLLMNRCRSFLLIYIQKIRTWKKTPLFMMLTSIWFCQLFERWFWAIIGTWDVFNLCFKISIWSFCYWSRTSSSAGPMRAFFCLFIFFCLFSDHFGKPSRLLPLELFQSLTLRHLLEVQRGSFENAIFNLPHNLDSSKVEIWSVCARIWKALWQCNAFYVAIEAIASLDVLFAALPACVCRCVWFFHLSI